MRQKPEDYVNACYQTSTYMAIYSNTVKPVNSMDLWLPSDEPAILPPQYNRQPGRRRTKRIKDASEKETDGPKLRRVPKSLKCSNCGILGHNMKTCHRHLPLKTVAAAKGTKKRKLNNGDATTTQPQPNGSKMPVKSKNELRSKAKQKAVEQKKKHNQKKAAARASTATPTATKGRPPRAPSSKDASAQTLQASSRSSVRIKENAKSRGK